jgi:K+-sensing histidine kinase KdpD
MALSPSALAISLVASAATQAVPSQVIRVAPAPSEQDTATMIIAIVVMLAFAMLVSWVAAMIFNWSMAPRRFWPRVVAAGLLPIAMFAGLFLSVEIFGRSRSLLETLERFTTIPVRGQLLLGAMLIVGLTVSWLTAALRNRREARKAQAALDAFA